MDASSTQELLAFFKAFAEPNRLRIAGTLARRPSTVEELAAMLELSESTVSHHLSYLSKAGLVSAAAHGYYSIYRFEELALENLAKRLLKKETLPAIAADVDLSAYDRKVLRTFLTRDGKLRAIPAQEKKFLAILRYAVQRFKHSKRYTEKQINHALIDLSEDTASLRRGFIEYKMMERAGGEYWRIDAE
jgi:ArsR family transcriptional regulator